MIMIRDFFDELWWQMQILAVACIWLVVLGVLYVLLLR
jgi:hypothetical protein